MSVNKQYLIDLVAEKNGVSKECAKSIINSFLDSIMERLEFGKKVRLFKFGTFEAKMRASRIYVTPDTGERVYLKAYRAPVFRASANFKRKIKGE